MTEKLFGNYNLVDILVELFVGIVILVLAAVISVFVRRNAEFRTPVIFGLMYGNYILYTYISK